MVFSLNNLREILDSLKKEGSFVIARAPYGSPWQSQMQKKRDCFVGFAPRNYNEEDRELEGVSNVMELYIRFIFALSFAIIFLYAQRGNR